jgi:voltage-gated potassium channel
MTEVRDRYNAFIDRHEVAWELTFAGLALVYVAVGFALEEPVPVGIVVLDLVLTGVFAAEFASRIAASYDRRRYIRGHWIDALALIPAVRGLRMLRLLRLLRLIRAFAGVARALTSIERLAAHRGLIWLFFAWLAVMLLCSLALFLAESDTNDAITSPFDALWWGVVTMTTVGYGDVFPVTTEGRIAAMVLMILGIALFSGVTATITSFLLVDDDPARSTVAADLGRLADLHARGDLTDEEYATAKGAVLAAVADTAGV